MGIYLSDESVSADVQLMRKLFTKYGKKLYLHILEKTDDRTIAKELTRQAFADVYSRMNSSSITDSFELLLNEFADTRMKRLEYSEEDLPFILDELEESLECEDTDSGGDLSNAPHRADRSVYVRAAQKEQAADMTVKDEEECPPPRRKSKAGLIVLTVAVCAIVGWCVAGSLMSMSWLPDIDLGYGWFESNVYKLF